MYDEACKRLSVHGTMVSCSDLTLLFADHNSQAQEIHLDMSTYAYIVSIAGSYVQQLDGSIIPISHVAATDVREFPDFGFLRYSLLDSEFSTTQWGKLNHPPEWSEVVPNGQVLYMVSTVPHAGPERLQPEILDLIVSYSKKQYIRFTLFQVVTHENYESEVRDSLVNSTNGLDLQINFWNHLNETVPDWYKQAKYQDVLNAMKEHDLDL